MASDNQIVATESRPMQVDHACGHRFTHLVPFMDGEDTGLLGLLEVLSSHPCPVCMSGMSEWAVGVVPSSGAGSHAGAC